MTLTRPLACTQGSQAITSSKTSTRTTRGIRKKLTSSRLLCPISLGSQNFKRRSLTSRMLPYTPTLWLPDSLRIFLMGKRVLKIWLKSKKSLCTKWTSTLSWASIPLRPRRSGPLRWCSNLCRYWTSWHKRIQEGRICQSTWCILHTIPKLESFGNGLTSLRFNSTLSLTHPSCKWSSTRTRTAARNRTQPNASQFSSTPMEKTLNTISMGAAINRCAHTLLLGSISRRYLTTKKDSLRKSNSYAIRLSNRLRVVSP